MPKILGTHKKSQTINHSLTCKIIMIKVILLFICTLDEGDDKTRKKMLYNNNNNNKIFEA